VCCSQWLDHVLSSALAATAAGDALCGRPRVRRNCPSLTRDVYPKLSPNRYGDLGFTGHPTTHTPNIDALANGGKILNSWYSGCPVCSGSRTALMTGRQYTRVGCPGVFGDSSTTGLPLNETTVADQLKKAGYATAIMGKWHL
jgi:hypothetical protein